MPRQKTDKSSIKKFENQGFWKILSLREMSIANDEAIQENMSFGLLRHKLKFIPRNDVRLRSFFSHFTFHFSLPRLAFTLAEVLITLGVIGIIAAITIPTLMNKTNDKETISALKKTYSVFSQAYTMAVNENGTPDTWMSTSNTLAQNSVIVLNTLLTYLKPVKNCGNSSDCISGSFKNLGGSATTDTSTWTDDAKAQLVDGSAIRIYINDNTCLAPYGSNQALTKICGSIMVDTNGYKAPNQYGIDVFFFWFGQYGITPLGTSTDTTHSFSSYCSSSDNRNNSGIGCAAWVIYNENMDYTKSCGSTLSWTGPTSCN